MINDINTLNSENAEKSVELMPKTVSLSYPIEGGNPFMVHGFYTNRVVKGSYKGKGKIDLSNVDAEECEVSINLKRKPVVIDVQPYYKLFDFSLDLLFGLKPAEIYMLFYIFKSMEKDSDIVKIDVDSYCKEYGYNKRIPLDAIRGLVRGSFIARTNKRGLYFINAHLFFRGNRVKKYGEYDSVTKTNKL